MFLAPLIRAMFLVFAVLNLLEASKINEINELCGPLEEVLDSYEHTLSLVLYEDDLQLWLRAHLPTLWEYARRGNSTAELGVKAGWSSIAFARAALEAESKGSEYRYWMYDIIHPSGVDKISAWFGHCQFVNFRFLEGDLLNQKFLKEVGQEDGPFPSHDVIFIDTSHTREQLTQELHAFAGYTKKYIILHDTESFGKKDESVHDEGTEISYRRKLRELEKRQVWHIQRLMDEQQVQSLRDLDVHDAVEAVQQAEDELDESCGLRNAVSWWLKSPEASGEWEILEHSIADNGMTILGRRPKSAKWSEFNQESPRWHNSTHQCLYRLWKIRQLAPKLLFLSHRFPRVFADATSLDNRRAQEIKVEITIARRYCPGHWAVKAALQMLQWHMSATKAPIDSIATHKKQLILDAKLQSTTSADTFLAILTEHQFLDELQWIDLLENSIIRWPYRLEAWYQLAKSLTHRIQIGETDRKSRALHAWRRSLVLCGKNRWVALVACDALHRLGRSTEAESWWRHLTGDRPGPEQLWDFKMRPSPVKLIRLTPDSKNSETSDTSERSHHIPFTSEEAKEFIETQMPYLHSEIQKSFLASGCSENVRCEQVLLEYSACNFISSCFEYPKVCEMLVELEARHGLRIMAASSVVETNNSFNPKANWDSFPGRLRLFCPLTKVEVIQNDTSKETTDSCLWMDESLKNSLSFRSFQKNMQFFIVDIIHPSYYSKNFELEISGEPFNSVLWLQSLIAHLGADDGHLGIHLFEPELPSKFPTRNTWGLRWLQFAVSLPDLKKNICVADLAAQLSVALQEEDYGKARMLLKDTSWNIPQFRRLERLGSFHLNFLKDSTLHSPHQDDQDVSKLSSLRCFWTRIRNAGGHPEKNAQNRWSQRMSRNFPVQQWQGLGP